jgi:cofilin
MLSGLELADDCLDAFEKLRRGRNCDYVIYRLNDDLTAIEVEKIGQGGREALVADLVAARNPEDLKAQKSEPRGDCRYAILDFKFHIEGGDRSKLCFVSWCPEDTSRARKMVHASSKDILKKAVNLIVELQAENENDLREEDFMDKFRITM